MTWRLSDTQCIQKYRIDPAICICAGETGGNKDTCQGDSGGPLVVLIGNKWMLGGLTSFGIGCSNGGVYARTSNYYNWILENLQNNGINSLFSTKKEMFLIILLIFII